MRLKIANVFVILSLVLMPTSAFADTQSKAMDIQKVTSPSGITAWLVESHTLPMVSVQVAFRAGSAFDPINQRGVANLTAGMLTQGAGELDAEAFQKQKERLGAHISAGAGLLNITASFDALSEVADETFALFSQALINPTFAEEDFVRLQKSVIASRKRVPEQPRKLAQEAFAEAVYGRYHPYSQPTEGTLRSVQNLNVEDVRAYHQKMFNKANMVVSVVGDITPTELSALMEKHLSGLPKGKKRAESPSAPKPQPPTRRVIEKDIPQTTVVMGHKGLNRSVPDYFDALVANHILGGGGFSSQLMQEVREKRGLVYGISSYFNPLPHWGAFRVIAQTKNETTEDVINVVKAEIRKLRTQGVSEEDYDAALNYLIGSFPLRLDSNGDILGYLTFMQTEGLGMEYMNNWVEKIKAVSRADVQKAAQKWMNPEEMAIVLVGNSGQAPKPSKTAEKTPQIEQQATPKKSTKPSRKEPEQKAQPVPKSQKSKQVDNDVVEEESVAAPVGKVKQDTLPQNTAKKAKPQVKQPTRPQNRTRRNTESDSWL